MGTPKPLIVPWLRRKLDGGCYPGVRWLDQGRTQFRVPWKHGLRQDASTEDFQLFRDWAIDSGSYRPDQDAPAPSVWKRNFRSALNRKPGIQVLRDHSSDSADPHKGFGDFPPPGPAPSSLEQLLGSNELMTFFEVRVYYRGHLVLQTLVPNPQGFRLVPPNPGPSPCPELTDVVLPEPGGLPDRVQASYTARLLQGLGAGVLLRVEGPGVCATRLGRLHAYWGRTETPAPGAEGGELAKEGYTPLYDLPRFVRELICFMEGQGSSPIYELWLCLGEAWPDSGRSWKKKLLMVQVVPTALQTLHQLSQAGGASSLRAEELDLRISDSLGEAGLLGALRDWEERMESQPYG
ncbi:ABC transporter permease/ATP-binding protein CydC [Platysternon megacephalum]|uniref:ABC transporter permease/ATP-binding protein CydC n=1 Tax=Platysternon megacephalum TaxID=55544 RepID=A0A4D9DNC4_9SAUR|nr:ABC transporter permease/ATP-binding protein CydC [Platysternon megacephalum]